MELLDVKAVMEFLKVGRPTAERIMDECVKHRRNQKRLVSKEKLIKYLTD